MTDTGNIIPRCDAWDARLRRTRQGVCTKGGDTISVKRYRDQFDLIEQVLLNHRE